MRLFVLTGCLIAISTSCAADEPLQWLAPQAVSAVDISADGHP